MLQSQLFTKTSRSVSTDEVSINARLLTQGGFIDKQMSGAYSYLPLGWRVFKKIEQIIREEMDALGGQELEMTALQPRELWDITKRWDTPEQIMYKFEEKSGQAIGLAWTHEEAITRIAKRFISSYRDLPRYVYQIQTKFRNEPRAKSGIIRTREFVMKDLYSFHMSETDLDTYYEKAKKAYLKVFKRCGLEVLVVEASGGAFTKKYSHEFQVLSDAGEDKIVYCDSCKWAQNQEVSKVKEGDKCPECRKKIGQGKSIEVGNIFKLGTKFSEDFKLYFTDEEGKKKPVIMASYGIGPGRVMGTIVEVHHDRAGIVWPLSVAPFVAHLLVVGHDKKVQIQADGLYKALTRRGIEVLFDDRLESPGVKFKDADLLGIPWRIVVSVKTHGKIELKARADQKIQLVSLSELLSKIIIQP
ncbi:MAG: aminoacyl--tRNA ligase-related protein [Patescibacteria group bacterium]